MKAILFAIVALSTLLRAELTFDSQKKDIKAPPDARVVVCDFFFENKGKETVKIARYESTCSCMSVQINQGGKLEYAPGERGILRANFDMENFTGEVDKNVVLWMDGDAESDPSFVLVVHVIIPVLVDIQPRTMEWQGPGPWEAKSMKIVMNHSEPIHLLRASINNPCFESELKTITEGKEYELIVKPLMNPDTVPGLAVVHMETDCKIEKQRRQMAYVVVRHDLPRVPAQDTAPQAQEPSKP